MVVVWRTKKKTELFEITELIELIELIELFYKYGIIGMFNETKHRKAIHTVLLQCCSCFLRKSHLFCHFQILGELLLFSNVDFEYCRLFLF